MTSTLYIFQTSAEMPVATSGIAVSNVGFTYFSKFEHSSLLHSRNLQRSPSLDVNCLFFKLSTLLTILTSSTALICISSSSASMLTWYLMQWNSCFPSGSWSSLSTMIRTLFFCKFENKFSFDLYYLFRISLKKKQVYSISFLLCK